MSEVRKKTEEELGREGWKLASTTSGEHLRRILEMYEEIGLDVYLEEVTPEECGGCTVCYTAGDETITRIYTRPRKNEPG